MADHGEEKKKPGIGDWIGGLLGLGFGLTVIGISVWEVGGRYVYGATPADLAAVSLDGTPKQLGRALAGSDVNKSGVRVKLRVGPSRPYDVASLDWDSSDLSAPTKMRLEVEHGEHDEEHAAQVATAFGRRFHAAHHGDTWRWGPVELDVDKKRGDVSFAIDRKRNSKTNALFDRQLDAARQVIVEAAFGIPVHASDQDLAELLGTGYPTADVGKIDPRTTIEHAGETVMARFPGSLHESSTSWEIALDHPLLASVTLDWSNQPSGMLSGVRFTEGDAYEASRDALQACLVTKLGPPKSDVTDYAAGTKNYAFAYGGAVLLLKPRHLELRKWDETTWARTFEALASCKETAENTGSRGDLKKK